MSSPLFVSPILQNHDHHTSGILHADIKYIVFIRQSRQFISQTSQSKAAFISRSYVMSSSLKKNSKAKRQARKDTTSSPTVSERVKAKSTVLKSDPGLSTVNGSPKTQKRGDVKSGSALLPTSALESASSPIPVSAIDPPKMSSVSPNTINHLKLEDKVIVPPPLPPDRNLPYTLILHTGGTFGMDISHVKEEEIYPIHNAENPSKYPAYNYQRLPPGTGGIYPTTLKPPKLLADIRVFVPEVNKLANLDVIVVFNRDSCRIGPKEWIQLAKILHKQRNHYDSFVILHGTDTMSYTAAALSLLLAGFGKPIVLTGSQVPLALPRSDARSNLIDAITCSLSKKLHEVAICFGGLCLRGNRAQKVSATEYRAFNSPMYPALAVLGVEVEWNNEALHKCPDVYTPRFNLDPNVIRIPIVPGSDPRIAYGDLIERGVRGVVLEAFGVGNLPDTAYLGWISWLKSQTKKGLKVYLSSQCLTGTMQPELYKSGSAILGLGAQSSSRMTPEAAVVKMMLCLVYKDLLPSVPIAGES